MKRGQKPSAEQVRVSHVACKEADVSETKRLIYGRRLLVNAECVF